MAIHVTDSWLRGSALPSASIHLGSAYLVTVRTKAATAIRRNRWHNPRIAKEYRHTVGKRIGNVLVTGLIRGGLGPKSLQLVTVRGRSTNKEYSTPIWVVEKEGSRYWVAVFGDTSTVKNARAAGRATLSRGSVRQDVRLTELPVSERAPLLRARSADGASPMVRPYFDATPQSSDAELAAMAPKHTVFRLEPA
jgi:hypothetical protein